MDAVVNRCYVVMLTQTVSFYNSLEAEKPITDRVVMLTQTVSFYNLVKESRFFDFATVVMLTQTVSFYNLNTSKIISLAASCHAYPNGKLLQLHVQLRKH